jgi:hypothetical protein
VKGFGYLLEAYLGLVVCYPILVRVSGLSFDYLLFGEISLERDIVLVDKSILKKFVGFSPPRGFPRINLVYTVDVFLSVILMHAVIVLIVKVKEY